MQCVVVLVDLLAYLSAEFLPLSREGGNPVEAESGLGEKRRDSAAWGWQEGSRAGGHSMLILEQLPAAYVVSEPSVISSRTNFYLHRVTKRDVICP